MHPTAARDPCRAGAAALRGRSLYPDGEAVAANRQPRRAGRLATLHLSARYADVGGHGSFARNSMRRIVATERRPECRGFGSRASFRRCASAAVRLAAARRVTDANVTNVFSAAAVVPNPARVKNPQKYRYSDSRI
jgi:hypothetical protein